MTSLGYVHHSTVAKLQLINPFHIIKGLISCNIFPQLATLIITNCCYIIVIYHIELCISYLVRYSIQVNLWYTIVALTLLFDTDVCNWTGLLHLILCPNSWSMPSYNYCIKSCVVKYNCTYKSHILRNSEICNVSYASVESTRNKRPFTSQSVLIGRMIVGNDIWSDDMSYLNIIKISIHQLLGHVLVALVM